MDLNSPLFDRVRIRTEEAEARQREAPACQHPGCARPGEFRAPKGRNREGQYFRFCLAHVQEYNKSYNYFDGMSDDAVARFQKEAVVGHRPTWTIGVNAKPPGPAYVDPFDLFEQAGRTKPRAAPEPPRRTVGKLAAKALETLDLEPSADAQTIRTRYKELVKRLHPDANGGDRSREDKLREIINAYNTLKLAGLT